MKLVSAIVAIAAKVTTARFANCRGICALRCSDARAFSGAEFIRGDLIGTLSRITNSVLNLRRGRRCSPRKRDGGSWSARNDAIAMRLTSEILRVAQDARLLGSGSVGHA